MWEGLVYHSACELDASGLRWTHDETLRGCNEPGGPCPPHLFIFLFYFVWEEIADEHIFYS